jgi:hypothetical protein
MNDRERSELGLYKHREHRLTIQRLEAKLLRQKNEIAVLKTAQAKQPDMEALRVAISNILKLPRGTSGRIILEKSDEKRLIASLKGTK